MPLRRLSTWFWPGDSQEVSAAKGFAGVLLLIIASATLFLVLTGGDWARATEIAVEKGRKVKLIELVKEWTWKAAVIDCVLATILLLTLRWWAGISNSVKPASVFPGAMEKRGKWFLPTLLALVLVGGLVRAPRLGMGFYNDEAHNFVRMTAGEFKQTSPGTDAFVWKPVRWFETLWYNTAGNNSQPHSILSRLSYGTWKSLAGAVDGEVNEIAVRLPAFAVGLFSLFLLGLTLREIVGQRAAVLGVLAGVVHGWHVRYSSEARGYSLLILGVVIILFFLNRALRTGTWRNWLGYGFGVLVCVWSFNGSVYFLAVLNGLLFLRQIWLWKKGDVGLDQILRPMVAGAFAVVVALPLMLPHVPQLMRVLNEWQSIRGKMGFEWWREVAGYLLAGCRWLDSQPDNPVNLAVGRLLTTRPALWLLVAGFVGVVLIGVARLIRRGGAARILMIATPTAFVLGWALMSRKGNYLHHWYLVYALPWLFCALGVGLEALFEKIERRLPKPVGLLSQVVLVSAVLALPTWAARGWMSYGKQDERAAVIAIRGAVYPHYKQGGGAGERPLHGAFWCNSVVYDPLGVVLHSVEDLQKLISRAKAEKRPLFVCFSHRPSAQTFSPELLQQVEGSGDFEQQAVFYGQEEPQFTSYLFRWKGNSTLP